MSRSNSPRHKDSIDTIPHTVSPVDEESLMPTTPSDRDHVAVSVPAPAPASPDDQSANLYPCFPEFAGLSEKPSFKLKSFAKGLPSAGWGMLVGIYFGGLAMKRSDVTALKALLFADSYVVNHLGAVLLFPRVIQLLKDMKVRRRDLPYILFVFSGNALAILSTIPITALAHDASEELFSTWPLVNIPNGDFKNGLKIVGDVAYIGNNYISRTWGATNLLNLGWELTLMRYCQPDRYFLREVAGYLKKYKKAHPSGFDEINDEFLKRLFHNMSIIFTESKNSNEQSWMPLLNKITTACSIALVAGSITLPPLLLYLAQKGGDKISWFPSNNPVLIWCCEIATHIFYARTLYQLFGFFLQVLQELNLIFNEKKLSTLLAVTLLTVITAAFAAISFFSGEGWGVEGRELEQLLQSMSHNMTNTSNPNDSYGVFGSVAEATYFSWASKLYQMTAAHYGSYWATYAGGVNFVFILTSLLDCLNNRNYFNVTFMQAFCEKFFRAYGLEDQLPDTEVQRKKNIKDAELGVHKIENFEKAKEDRDRVFEQNSAPAPSPVQCPAFLRAVGNCFSSVVFRTPRFFRAAPRGADANGLSAGLINENPGNTHNAAAECSY